MQTRKQQVVAELISAVGSVVWLLRGAMLILMSMPVFCYSLLSTIDTWLHKKYFENV
jgi:hypothetical protein